MGRTLEVSVTCNQKTSPSVGGWDEPKVTFAYVSIFSWATFDILLDFTIGGTIYFHPPYIKGGCEVSLSHLPPIAKLCWFFRACHVECCDLPVTLSFSTSVVWQSGL